MGAMALSLSPLTLHPSSVTCFYLVSLIRPYSVLRLIANTVFHGALVCICMYRVNNLVPTNHFCFLTALTWVFPFFLSPLLSIGYFLLLLLFLLLLIHSLLFQNFTI